MQAVSPATNQRRESIFRKRKRNKLSRKEEATVFNKQLSLGAAGAPFLRLPVTGRNLSCTGVHTYTSQGVCLCDSYTVIISDG